VTVGFLFCCTSAVRAACPPSCAIPGGSNPALDCQAEFSGNLRLNYPSFDPAHPKPGKEVRCFDGDAGCDLDDAITTRASSTSTSPAQQRSGFRLHAGRCLGVSVSGTA
jgi:hypothetical protein